MSPDVRTPHPLGRDHVIRRSTRIAQADLGDRSVLFNDADGSIHELDPVARFVWERLAGRSVDELWSLIVADYPGADYDDVVGLLERLDRMGLIEVGPPAGASQV